MAVIKGPFNYDGPLGGLSSYWNSRLKKWIVRTKGGANKNLILNSPTFSLTRKNMSEFKACGNWCHWFRMSLMELDHLNCGYYMAEVVKLSKIIQTMDQINYCGSRTIESSKYKSLLIEINFNEDHPFKKVLLRNPEVISDDERKAVIVNFPQLISWYELVWKKPYGYYRFTLTIGQLSDYSCQNKNNYYEPVHAGLEKRSVTVYSEWFSRSQIPVDISLTALFADNEIPPSDATVLVGLGIEFATSMSGNTVSCAKGDGTMALIACL